jgi:hypothetical protein
VQCWNPEPAVILTAEQRNPEPEGQFSHDVVRARIDSLPAP